MLSASSIDRTTARYLGYVLKILLGLEATIKLVLLTYLTVIEDSELVINLHKPKLDKFTQLLLAALVQKVLRYAEKRILHRR